LLGLVEIFLFHALINAYNSLIDYLNIHKHWNEGIWSDQTDQTTELF